jgi:hypothetical protein
VLNKGLALLYVLGKWRDGTPNKKNGVS